ncbi:SNase-like nuclease [filamentous cyanobacterium Phorm 6]|nr:SNase-like nuclease [filamentous cyanobacterium Phorm 6]
MLIANNGYSVLSKFVSDGDTLNLNFQGEQFVARLQWIDTPETKKSTQNSTDYKIQNHWSWAERAKTALINLVHQKPLICIPIEKDRFDRWVCDLYINNKISVANNVQIALCKAGMAVSYLPYNRYSYTSRELAVIRGIITETANANRKKVGIWSEPNFILPNEFKKLNLS